MEVPFLVCFMVFGSMQPGIRFSGSYTCVHAVLLWYQHACGLLSAAGGSARQRAG